MLKTKSGTKGNIQDYLGSRMRGKGVWPCTIHAVYTEDDVRGTYTSLTTPATFDTEVKEAGEGMSSLFTMGGHQSGIQ